jgi:hypothetical protein
MLATLTLSAVLLLQPTAPPDTTRQFRGYSNLPFAWGTMLLRKNKVVRAFLPLSSLRGLEMLVPYYPEVPETGPLPKPKFAAAPNVQWIRIGTRYWETLGSSRQEPGLLAARVQTGAIDLFMATAPATPILTALGSNPVLSSPADASVPEWAKAGPASWYLRRSGSTPVLVAPANFASQVAAFLHDDAELARRVASSQPGYRYPDLESIVQQYNQRVRR